MTRPPRVLGDHRKAGKRLVPPFIAALGPLQEVSWLRFILPEILWLSLIHGRLGHVAGVAAITALCRDARALSASHDRTPFAAASSFTALTPSDWTELKRRLSLRGDLFILQGCIEPLAAAYEGFPMQPLYEMRPEVAGDSVAVVREHVTLLADRSERESMMVQATAIWLTFDAGVLKVAPHLTLAEFPEIQNYPVTELSRRVGASVRSTLNMLFSDDGPHTPDKEWARSFWNQGIALTECRVDV